MKNNDTMVLVCFKNGEKIAFPISDYRLFDKMMDDMKDEEQEIIMIDYKHRIVKSCIMCLFYLSDGLKSGEYSFVKGFNESLEKTWE